MKPAAIVGWTGRGELADLGRSVSAKLGLKRGQLVMGAKSLLARGVDPVLAARKLAYMPGVSWVAVGYEFGDFEQCMERLATLAGRYLAEGATFSVAAQVEESRRTDGDVVLEANSRILYAVKGVTISEKSPRYRFRVLMVEDAGACGVELKEGPGGVPTSAERARCLVSGGYHSSVMAWMAALSGFSLTLVHAFTDDESLRQVARLYSELSYRTDPAGLELLVLEGDAAPAARLRGWLEGAGGQVFAGSHPECRGRAAYDAFRGTPSVLTPLLLVQESELKAKLRQLGLKERAADRKAALGPLRKGARFVTKRYGGGEADHNTVLDALLA